VTAKSCVSQTAQMALTAQN